MNSMRQSKKRRPDPEISILQDQLESAREELRQAYETFDQVVDYDLIDACIYRMNAALAQCNYLVRAIKERTTPDVVAAALEEVHGAWT